LNTGERVFTEKQQCYKLTVDEIRFLRYNEHIKALPISGQPTLFAKITARFWGQAVIFYWKILN